MRGHIRKRGTKWAVVVDIGRDENGKRVQKWHSGFARRKDAERALTEILGRVETGTYVEPAKLTVIGYLEDEWLPAIRATVRPLTYKTYQLNVRRVMSYIGSIRLQQLTPAMLNRMYGELGERLAPRTVRLCHAVLRRALADAVKWNRLARNPADAASPPRTESSLMRIWTAEQLRVFLDHVREDRLYAAWHVLAMTGMRRGELLGLTWKAIDLDAGRLAITQALVPGKGAPQLSEPKTARGRRNVALDPTSVFVLREHRKRHLEERFAWGPAYRGGDFVFCREDGSPFWPEEFSAAFKRLTKATDLPVIRLHDLRHTHATLALQAGVHPKVVSERLGHASIGITLDTYSHAIPALQEDAAAKVAALIAD
jgi:integrase